MHDLSKEKHASRAENERDPYRVAIFTTHPIQYQAPLFRAFAAHRELAPVVFFASRHGLEESFDEGFETSFKWDIPLLEGYKYVFLKNISRKPGGGRFTGLNTPSIFKKWRKGRFDAYLVMGWKNLAHWQAIGAALMSKSPLLLRGIARLDVQSSADARQYLRSMLWLPLRKLLYNRLFAQARAILTIGKRNNEYYRHFGVPDSKLFLAPHCVSNKHFRLSGKKRGRCRANLRSELGVEKGEVLFSSFAKLTAVKQPLDLLDAFARLVKRGFKVHLLYVGDGPMREDLEAEIKLRGLEERVTLAGFVNQSGLPAYYAAVDCLVLPSLRETWGLVVNEAMAAGLPVIVSDAAGCAPDLVHEGKNGFTFPHRDTKALARQLSRVAQLSENERQAWGRRSQEIISDFTPARVANVLVEVLQAVTSKLEV